MYIHKFITLSTSDLITSLLEAYARATFAASFDNSVYVSSLRLSKYCIEHFELAAINSNCFEPRQRPSFSCVKKQTKIY